MAEYYPTNVPITKDFETASNGAVVRVTRAQTAESIGLSPKVKMLYDNHAEIGRTRLVNPNPIDLDTLVNNFLDARNKMLASQGNVSSFSNISTDTGVTSINQIIGVRPNDYDATAVQTSMASWLKFTMVADSALEKSPPMLLDFVDAKGTETWNSFAVAGGPPTATNMAFIRLVASDGERIQYGNASTVPCGIIPTALLQRSVAGGFAVEPEKHSIIMLLEELVNKMVTQHPSINQGAQEQMIFGYNIGDRITSRVHSGLVNVIRNRSLYTPSDFAYVLNATPGGNIGENGIVEDGIVLGNPIPRSAVLDHIYAVAESSNMLALVSQPKPTTLNALGQPPALVGGPKALAEIRAEVVARGGVALVANQRGGDANDIAVRHAVITYKYCENTYVCIPIAAEEILVTEETTMGRLINSIYATRYTQWTDKSDVKRFGTRMTFVAPRKVASLLNRLDFLMHGSPIHAIKALTASFDDSIGVTGAPGALQPMSAQFNSLPIMLANDAYPASTARTNTFRGGSSNGSFAQVGRKSAGSAGVKQPALVADPRRAATIPGSRSTAVVEDADDDDEFAAPQIPQEDLDARLEDLG